MTLILSGSSPEGLEAKFHDFTIPPKLTLDLLGTSSQEGREHLTESFSIPIEDFIYLVKYVMTNVDLKENDPRLELIDWIKSLKIVEGFNVHETAARLEPKL